MSDLFPDQEWPTAQPAQRFLLLDGAQFTGLAVLLTHSTVVNGYVRLFDGLLADRSADTSVFLVSLNGGRSLRSLFRQLAGPARYSGGATVLDTSLSRAELAQRLTRRLDARLPNGKEFIARFYDGRVLPLLHSVMTDEQRASFFALGRSWWYVMPERRWGKIDLLEEDVDPYVPPLALDDPQRRQLMNDSYPYTLIDHFNLTDPGLIARVSPDDRYRFLRDTMRMAAGYGVRDGQHLHMVCTWALLLGEDFHEEAAWRQRLRDLGAGRRTTKEIVDEVWPKEEVTWDE
ncbi:hypothetical protein CO641_08415 [Lysobacteraceae bacterium NML91-0213]|nr:hypothetical protein CO641_08415 [Xanthomonadaceae bacterium NML91-0213]